MDGIEPAFQGAPYLDAAMSGGARMKDGESSFTVKSSSFGTKGGRYVHASMNRAAIKAARQLFRKAEKASPSGSSNRVVEFELVDITRGKGSRRPKPAFYRVTRTPRPAAQTMKWAKGNSLVSKWSYKLERLSSAESTISK